MGHTSTTKTVRATVTIPELAILLGLNKASAYEMASAGRLPVPTFRSGRRVLASRHAVEELLGRAAVAALLDVRHADVRQEVAA